MSKFNVLGVNVDRVDMKEALSIVKGFLKDGGKHKVFTPNSEIVMNALEDDKLMKALNSCDLVIPDGIGLVLASKILKKPLVERVTGIDLMEEILKYANEEEKSIFIVGGKPGVSQMACDNISKKYSGIKIAGNHNGYFKGNHTGNPGHEEELKVIDLINESKPDILFVAFGAPKQEFWIEENIDRIDSKVFMGVGGSVDVYADVVKRAPVIYQKLCLEWFYRLVKEPWRYKRMMKLPLFVIEVLKRGR